MKSALNSTCSGCLQNFDPLRINACSGCRQIRYCSQECQVLFQIFLWPHFFQKSHWDLHKFECSWIDIISDHSPCFENARFLLHVLALAEGNEDFAKQISNLAHNVVYEFDSHISECFRKLDNIILSKIKGDTIYSSYSFELRAKMFVLVQFFLYLNLIARCNA